MGEKPQINLKLEDSQKEKWENYLEESHKFSTISSLIRTSVEVMIEDSDEEDQGVPQELNADIDEMKENVMSIQRDVTTLLKHQRDEDGISEFALDVFDSLRYLPDHFGDPLNFPDIPEDTGREKFRNQDAAHMVINDTGSGDIGEEPQTATAIAKRLDEDSNMVEEAIEWLHKHNHPVVEVELEGERHYFKEE